MLWNILYNHHFLCPKIQSVATRLLSRKKHTTIFINFGSFLFRKHTLTLIFIHFYIPEISENSSFKYVTKLALGSNKLSERGTSQLTFSSKHQCIFSLLPGSTTAVVALDVVHRLCESYNGELLWVSLQGTKNKQFKLPFFWLNQGFLGTFWHLSQVMLSQHED